MKLKTTLFGSRITARPHENTTEPSTDTAHTRGRAPPSLKSRRAVRAETAVSAPPRMRRAEMPPPHLQPRACAQHGAQQHQSRAWAAEPWAHAGAAPPLSTGRRLPPHCLMHTHTYTSCTRVTPPVSLRRPLRLPPARSPLPLPSARCLPPPPQLRPQLRPQPSASVLSPRPVLHPPR